MNPDWRIRGFGAFLVSAVVAWVADRAGMSHSEAFIALAMVLFGLRMMVGSEDGQ